MFAGPAANFFFSIILLVFINCFYGYTTTKPIISSIELNSPAEKAGLKVGDTIITDINGSEISDFNSLHVLYLNNNDLKFYFTTEIKS